MKLAPKTINDLVILVLLTLISTLLIWLPHFLSFNNFYYLNFSEGFNTIYKNYDGLEYIIIAKSLYNPEIISTLPQSLPEIYYAAHFPFYSLLIILFAPVLGFLKSMLFVTLLSTIGSVIVFYFLIKNFKLTEHPLALSLVFLMIPARWVIVRSIGSSEPTFILFVLLALYFFLKFEQTKSFSAIILTGVFGMFAQITRPPGVLLFIALSLFVLYKIFFLEKIKSVNKFFSQSVSYLPLTLIPLGLLGIFYLFYLNYNDFWAYFHTGDNIHLVFPPYQIFNTAAYWVGTIWLEDIVYLFILGFLGGIYLLKRDLKPLGFFVLIYLTASIFVAHRDISRYILPTFPFLLIAFEKVLTSKEFRIVLIIVALGIYLYSQNFLLGNTAPIPNLGPFN